MSPTGMSGFPWTDVGLVNKKLIYCLFITLFDECLNVLVDDVHGGAG